MSKFEHIQEGEKISLKRKPTEEEKVREALAEMQEFLTRKHQDFKPKHVLKNKP